MRNFVVNCLPFFQAKMMSSEFKEKKKNVFKMEYYLQKILIL